MSPFPEQPWTNKITCKRLRTSWQKFDSPVGSEENNRVSN